MKYIHPEDKFSSYMIFPKFLLEENINPTAMLLYMLLLDRSRLSQTNHNWTDEHGNVFITFTVSNMSSVLNRKETAVKSALRILEKRGLIIRKHQGPGKPNRIYVLVPDEFVYVPPPAEIRPKYSRKTAPATVQKPPTNKNKNINNINNAYTDNYYNHEEEFSL